MYEDINKSQKKTTSLYYRIGILSIVLGVLGILVSGVVFFLLKAAIGPGFNPNVTTFINLLNIFDKVEKVIKILGILIAIVGVAKYRKNQLLPMIGLIINSISVLLTIFLFYYLNY